MKILVFAERLEFGGTQVNAIELTEALRDRHGHDVVIFAAAGPLVRLAEEKRLRVLPAPRSDTHPSPAVMQALRVAVRREKPDLIHVWDWTQCMDAYYSVHLPMRIPMVVTVMTMDLPRLLPKALPTTLGTPELRDQASTAGRKRLELILPPVDIHRNAPGVADGAGFRRSHGIHEGEIALVTVSRLVKWMKAESLRDTIQAVRTLARELPVRLVIVGDGTAKAELGQLAAACNCEFGRPVIVMAGAMLDPRPAYAGADIVVGMGGSALRGMAFGKPVIIVGEKGFSDPFNPNTAAGFYYHGIYGAGNGEGGYERLLGHIRALATGPEKFPMLGDFSREFVVRNFSVEKVSDLLSAFCLVSAAATPRFDIAVVDGLRTAAVGVGRKYLPAPVRRKLKACRGAA